MKAAVGRLKIFAVTRRAHRKVRHRRVGTIVGNLIHDRKAWSTVCAVGEGITIPPFLWIKHFRATGRANRGIGSDARAVLATYTLGNAKVLKVLEVQDLGLNIFDL